jgi:hypothetical protein
MTKRWLGALAALSMVSVGACSSSTTPVVATKDAGVVDMGHVVTPTPETGTPDDTGTTPEASPTDDGGTGDTAAPTNNTTGDPCVPPAKAADPNTCDPTKGGTGFCDTTVPNPTCAQQACDIPDPKKIAQCDNNKGICLNGGTTNYCIAACTFAGDATAPTGCAAGNTCSPYGWAPPAASTPLSGIGYCEGTCASDADCKAAGSACQVENGACVPKAKKVTYAKKLGDACTYKSPGGECNCRAPASGTAKGKGVCTSTCIVGGAACGTGFVCTAGLPKFDTDGTTVLFTAEPAGMRGDCLRACTADADCAAYNGTCKKDYIGAASTGVCEVAFGG